jgi:hypothetical protein
MRFFFIMYKSWAMIFFFIWGWAEFNHYNMFVYAFQKFKKKSKFFDCFSLLQINIFFSYVIWGWVGFPYVIFFYWLNFFYIVQKLGDDNCFSFEVELNFLIKACLFLCFKYTLKNFEFFLFFSLIQINIYFKFFVLFWCDWKWCRSLKLYLWVRLPSRF